MAKDHQKAGRPMFTSATLDETRPSNAPSVPAIEAEGLVKLFGETRAVDGLNLNVPAGDVYGVLGPNGAGKTTTIRMLATLTQPDGGSAPIFRRRNGGKKKKKQTRTSLAARAQH